MRRREFITLLGGAAAWPLAARAQQAMPVVGWLVSGYPADAFGQHLVAAFRQGLADADYVEGRNVAIEYRWAEHEYDRLPGLATDLVRRHVDVIAAIAGVADAQAAKAATTTIPIVFNVAGDPVQLGLVASLNRPGGNLTGVSLLNVELVSKRLELLHELVPTATLFGLLVDPTSRALAEATIKDTQTAARTLGLQVEVLHASTERDFEMVFASLRQLRAGGLTIGPRAFFNSSSEQLAALALRHKVPAIYQYRAFAAAGGLMSYGPPNLTDSFRQAGVYVGRILKGEKPADLPVQQTTKVGLIINLKTANTLGLPVPTGLLVRADEVIE
jgi:putative ABC transport system substrate-binding protein